MKQLAHVSYLSLLQNYLVFQRILPCVVIPKGMIIPFGRQAKKKPKSELVANKAVSV